MKMKACFLFCIFLFIGSGLMAQNTITVSGVISDRNTGEPLMGVTVVDKNRKAVGTVSDIDGKYSISVQENTTLIFSFIGYIQTEKAVQGRVKVDVQLSENTQELETVVVVGLLMKKSDLTGAAARISSEDLKVVPTANINKALQGKVPGVYIESSPNPGTNAKIKIRGSNSIKFGKDPIYVVDNIMLDNGFEGINPDDIASIDILKDASATALYGARGANGVVVITTKKGRAGHGKVTYDAWFGSQSFTKNIPMLSANDLVDFRVDAFANVHMDKNPNANRQNHIDRFLLTDNMNRNAAFSQEEWDSYTNGMSYNWLDEVVRTGYQQNHSVSVSGGSETGNYYVSAGYNNQIGQIRDSKYKRYTGKVNLEEKVKPWLTIGTNNSFIYSDANPYANENPYNNTSSESDRFLNALRANPLLPISDEYWYLKEGKIDNQSSYNPLRDLYIDKKSLQTRTLSSSFANIKVMEGLDFRSTFSFDILQREDYIYNPTNSTQSYKASKNGQAIHRKGKWSNWQWDNTVSFNRTFNEKHRVSAMVGTSMSYYSNTWNEVDAAGFGNDLFSYKKLNGATSKDMFYLNSDFTTNSLMSYLTRLNYVYDSRYYITATARYDGSSRFGPENQWGLFPSIAGSWNITGEDFMQDQKTFDNLRLRLGYGLSGNQNIPNYGYLTRFSPTSSLGSNILQNSGLYGNPDLKWETQKQLNAGIDVGVLNNRLNFVLDFFYIKNDDLLMERSMSGSSGYQRQLANLGSMENKGVEFSVNTNIIDTKDFKWDMSFNISADRNKITRLYDDMDAIYNLGGYSNNEIQREGNLFVGKSINNIYVYKFDKIAQESDMGYVNSLDLSSRIVKPGDILPLDKDGNGRIDDADRSVVGSTDPDFYGGITTSLSYKGFALNVAANYSVGAEKNSYLYEMLMGGHGASAAHRDIANRWTPENTNTNIARAYSEGGRYGYGDVDWAVQDASYLRLSVITLSYSLPNKWLSPLKIDNLRFYVTGNNLVTFTKYKGFDPEGGDWYPTSKMYVFGLNLSF